MVCDRGVALAAVTLAMTCLAFILVGLRLYVRIFVNHNFGYDDCVIIVALIFTVVMTSAMLGQAYYGVGEHIQHLEIQDIQGILFWFYISVIFYNNALGLVKISILVQYMEIFLASSVHIACVIGLIWMVCFTIETTTISIFDCWPVQYFWDKSVPFGSCVDFETMWFCHAALNIVSDIYLIVLPLPSVIRLRLPLRQRLALVFAISLGIFVCVASSVRLVFLNKVARSDDVTYDNIDAAIWSCVELCLALICASLPTFKSLLCRRWPNILPYFSTSRFPHNSGAHETVAYLQDPISVPRPAHFREYNYESFRTEPEYLRESESEDYPVSQIIDLEPRTSTDRSLSETSMDRPISETIAANEESLGHLSELERGENTQNGIRRDSSFPDENQNTVESVEQK
ncbi:uncharacterized protein IWZ02DRAFT_206505 [Phyllosticta citriasiana]|uniref:uncharacterized protein n=1 Tax=Phyllosticta citriasiana TaxID=595635 RepID=UPI0030FDD312